MDTTLIQKLQKINEDLFKKATTGDIKGRKNIQKQAASKLQAEAAKVDVETAAWLGIKVGEKWPTTAAQCAPLVELVKGLSPLLADLKLGTLVTEDYDTILSFVGSKFSLSGTVDGSKELFLTAGEYSYLPFSGTEDISDLTHQVREFGLTLRVSGQKQSYAGRRFRRGSRSSARVSPIVDLTFQLVGPNKFTLKQDYDIDLTELLKYLQKLYFGGGAFKRPAATSTLEEWIVTVDSDTECTMCNSDMAAGEKYLFLHGRKQSLNKRICNGCLNTFANLTRTT